MDKSIVQHLNIPPSFLQHENCNFLLQKEIVLLTICLHQSCWEKVPFSSKLSIFIQKGETVGLPKVTFGLPNLSFPNILLFLNVLQKIVTNYSNDRSFMRRVPLEHLETSSMTQHQRKCPQMRRVPKIEC